MTMRPWAVEESADCSRTLRVPNPPSGPTFLDTSVLLSDPWACTRFAEHEVVVPLVVISELEAKRHHHELGWFARQALRLFDDLRLEHGRLDQPIPLEPWWDAACRAEPQRPVGAARGLPDREQRFAHPDLRANLAAEGKLVTLVSKDIPLRVKAGAVGLFSRRVPRAGRRDVRLDGHGRDRCVVRGDRPTLRRRARSISSPPETCPATPHSAARRELPCAGQGEPRQAGAARSRRSRCFGLRGRSAEQRVALDLLLDESVGNRVLGGRRATGKSAWRCARAWRLCWNAARNASGGVPAAVRGGRTGSRILPGSESDKMGPWAGRLRHAGRAGESRGPGKRCCRGACSKCCPSPILGPLLHDSFVIVDEAQSLVRNVLLTVLSRLGAGSRVVLTHDDLAQRDNLRVGRHDGVAAVIEKLKGQPVVRPHHAAAQRALADRRAGHRDAGGDQPRRPAVMLSYRPVSCGRARQRRDNRAWQYGLMALGVVAAVAIVVVALLTGRARATRPTASDCAEVKCVALTFDDGPGPTPTGC